MPSTVITSTRPSSCASTRSGSVAYDREYREYGASKSPCASPCLPPLRSHLPRYLTPRTTLTPSAKHTSTSTRTGGVVIHNHNKGIEDVSAPSPSYSRSRR